MPSSRNEAQLNSNSSTFNHRCLDFRIASSKTVCYRIYNVLRQLLFKEWSAGIFILPEAAFSLETRWWSKKIKVVQTDPCHSFFFAQFSLSRSHMWLRAHFPPKLPFNGRNTLIHWEVWFHFQKKYSFRINFSLWISPTCSNIWLLGLEIVRNSPSLIWTGVFFYN